MAKGSKTSVKKKPARSSSSNRGRSRGIASRPPSANGEATKRQAQLRPAERMEAIVRDAVRSQRSVASFGPQHRFADRVHRGLGWLRDLPDFRDATVKAPAQTAEILQDEAQSSLHQRALHGVARRAGQPKTRPPKIDNRIHCSPVEDQGNLGSCTANACVGLVEYMERRATGQHIDGSRLFLYKVTRKLLGWDGDTGAFLRTTMKALVHFGLPPEEWWEYAIDSFDDEPDSFLYAYALSCRAIKYVRLDPSGLPLDEVLDNVRAAIASGFAAMFGFTVYDSLEYEPDIPFPGPTDRQDGGHAVLCVGYDDQRTCRGTDRKGALLIRNSWGRGWGDGGYGWLPYEYVLRGLANDFWTCYQVDWIDSRQFE